VSTVDEDGWAQLRSDLATSYAELSDAIADHALDSEITLAISMGSTAHVAYHLGAVRQKLKTPIS